MLGLRCGARYGRIPGAEYETGPLTLQVLDAASVGAEFTPSAPIALRVDDVAAARAALDSRGVPFVAAFDSGVCHQAAFHDPDGNAPDPPPPLRAARERPGPRLGRARRGRRSTADLYSKGP